MKISSRLAISIHTILAINAFCGKCKITSEFLATSINIHPVVIRKILSQLNTAGLTQIASPKVGITMNKSLDEITIYDLYIAVDCADENLFNFHSNPNSNCPIGKNIHKVLDCHFDEIQKNFESMLSDVKLSSLASDIDKIRS